MKKAQRISLRRAFSKETNRGADREDDQGELEIVGKLSSRVKQLFGKANPTPKEKETWVRNLIARMDRRGKAYKSQGQNKKMGKKMETPKNIKPTFERKLSISKKDKKMSSPGPAKPKPCVPEDSSSLSSSSKSLQISQCSRGGGGTLSDEIRWEKIEKDFEKKEQLEKT